MASLAAFRTAFPDASIHYAMKANSEPEVLHLLESAGASFEVASLGEWVQLRAACPNVSAERVLFGTAVKPATSIRALSLAGVDLMAADSPEELRRIAAHARGSRVLLRVIVDHGDSAFSMSEKFGAPVGDVPNLVVLARELGLVPYGLSFNVGSQARQAWVWANAVESLTAAVHAVRDAGTEFVALNLGGGYPQQYSDGPVSSPAAISAAVTAALRHWPYAPQLILEPGRAIIASAVDLYTSVVSRVRRGDRDWLYLDAGVYNALFEALACQGTTRYSVSLAERRTGAHRQSFVLAGPTGDGLDVVHDDADLPVDVQEGDLLRIKAVGAYTSAVASRFNGFDLVPTRAHAFDESCALCSDLRAHIPNQYAEVTA